MTLPKKISVGFASGVKAPELMDEVGKIFHDWVRLSELDDLLVDVADYRHVEGGPGVLLVGHECNYQLRLTENGMLEARCSQKRGYSSGRCPVTETFARAVKVCRLLEERTGRAGLFDCSRARVGARDRLSTQHSAFSIDEFVWHVRQSLAPHLFTVPQLQVRSGSEFLEVEVSWVAERTFRGLDEGVYRTSAPAGVAVG